MLRRMCNCDSPRIPGTWQPLRGGCTEAPAPNTCGGHGLARGWNSGVGQRQPPRHFQQFQTLGPNRCRPFGLK